MTKKSLIVSLVVIIGVIAIAGAYLYKENKPLGSVAGPDVLARMYFHEGLTTGGRIATSSTAATYTTSARDFATLPTFIDWTVNVNTTVSLSATSTRGYVPKIGDVAVIYLRNASTTEGSTMTLAAVDAGVDLQTATSTLTITGKDVARLTLIRQATHLTTIIFDRLVEAD